MSICTCENEIKNDFLDKPNVGNHSEGLECVDESNMKREKGRNRTFARLCGLDVLIFDPENRKIFIFSCEHEINYDFLVIPNVDNNSEGLECVDESNIKREKGRNGTFARQCLLDALIFDPENSKNVVFSCENEMIF